MAIDNPLKQYFLMVNGDVVSNTDVSLIQSMFAAAAVVMTDGEGDPVWDAAAADAVIYFDPPLAVAGLTAAGAGATDLVYVYLA